MTLCHCIEGGRRQYAALYFLRHVARNYTLVITPCHKFALIQSIKPLCHTGFTPPPEHVDSTDVVDIMMIVSICDK